MKTKENRDKEIKGVKDNSQAPGLAAFLTIYSGVKNNHEGNITKSPSKIKANPYSTRTVTIYQESYKVTYSRFDAIEINSIDGHSNIEDTFNDRFIEQVIEQIKEQEMIEEPFDPDFEDEGHDEHFQNQ